MHNQLRSLVLNKVYYKIFDRSNSYKNKIILHNPSADLNKVTILNIFSGASIYFQKQVHSNIIVDVDELVDLNLQTIGDGAVTTKPGVILTVKTADCAPVLCSSFDGKVIGVAHCGWRGSKLNIIEKLIYVMKSKRNCAFKAIIGPCIQQHSYEVGEVYYKNFINESYSYSKFFIASKKSSHYMFNLQGFVEFKLKESGVKSIERIDDDTFSISERYPSYRRSLSKGKLCNESILSCIIIHKQ